MTSSNSSTNLYSMLLIRKFEEKLCDFINSGEIKTATHLYIGQEAIATGVCNNLREQDLIWGNHRSHGHYLAKGGNAYSLMAEIFCKEDGCSGGRGGSMHIIDKSKGILGTVPIVAGTVPLAIGSALSQKFDKEKNISVSFLGDGATEEGHVLESMNIASLYNLPVLFVIENNLYSSHMHMDERRKQPDLQELGKLFGIKTKKLDGNNVNEICNESAQIIGEIRDNSKPQIIECMTFRHRGHVGASFDIDVGVKRSEELKEWLSKDPIDIEKMRLKGIGYSNEDITKIELEIDSDLDEMIARVRKSKSPDKSTIMNHVFTE